MDWIKRIALNLLVISVSVLVTLLLVETVLHFSSLKLKYLYPLEPGGYLRHDPEMGFDITPNFSTSTHAFIDLSYPVWSNSMGCFDQEYDGSSPYLYITGDSFTWGFTPLSEKWGKKVQNELGIRTLTCGVNAFGPRQELIKTRRDLARLAQPPKIIIVGYFEGNDFGDDYAPNFTTYKGYRVPVMTRCDQELASIVSPLVATTTCNVPEPQYSFLQKIKFELSLNSVLYMIAQRSGVQESIKGFLKRFAWGTASDVLNTSWPTIDKSSDQAWDVHKRNLLTFKDLADQYGSKLLFVLIPERETVRATSTPDVLSVHERVISILTSSQIEYVDLLPEFRAQEKIPEVLFYWPINEHWNVEGNRLAGELVSRYIREHGLLGTSTPL